MIPGQSRQIPAMQLQPGFSPMMMQQQQQNQQQRQLDNQNGIRQQMMMMATPAAVPQFAFPQAIYSMPQAYAITTADFCVGAMMAGPPRYMPPPPPYSMQMAAGFRPTQGNAMPPLTEEQQRKIEKDLKQRQFMEQQKRLQDLSALGVIKVDPDKMIESIIGKSDAGHRASRTNRPVLGGTSAMEQPKGLSKAQSGTGAEGGVFGEFLSSGPSGEESSQLQHLYQQQQPYLQHPSQVKSDTVVQGGSATQSSVGVLPAEVNRLEAQKENKKDLTSMMMQCSDLSVPKQAKRFEKKKAISEIQVTKSVTVTYNESKTARHWDSSTESLSELFTLPVALNQPASTYNDIQTNSVGVTPAAEFRLPRWITGEISAHVLYEQVLEAVTRENVISTEIVYQLLLRSGLPKETLGYIWGLCNRNTPGQLIREELFLILAMISIAQNGMDYSSLAILSKCPHAPVPNLGQFASPQVASPNVAIVTENVPTVPTAGPSSLPGRTVEPPTAGTIGPHYHAPATDSLQSHEETSTPPATLPGSVSSWHGPGSFQGIGGHPSSQRLPAVGLVMSTDFPQSVSLGSGVNRPSTKDDDDFDDFQAAPIRAYGLSRPGVGAAIGVSGVGGVSGGAFGAGTIVGDAGVGSVLRNSLGKDSELMKMDETDPADKYAVFRELSDTLNFGTAENSTSLTHDGVLASSNSSADITASATNGFGADFSDFASFDVASSSQIPVTPILAAGGSSSGPSGFGSLSTCDTITTRKSDFANNGKTVEAKSLVSNTSLFNTHLAGEGIGTNGGNLSDAVMGDVDVNGMTGLSETDDWGTFPPAAGGLQTFVSHSAQHIWNATEPSRNPDVECRSAANVNGDVGGWADFESASGESVVNQSHASSNSQISFRESAANSSKTKSSTSVTGTSKVTSIFGQNDLFKGPPTGLGISPLDFQPPELPNDDDDFDDFEMYPNFPKDSAVTAGISSLSTHYLEIDDERQREFGEKSAAASNVKLSSSHGMTQSSSANSLEFTGWKSLSNVAVKEPDVNSTSSLELRQSKMSDSRDDSPQQDVDSQSVSSLDFPPMESEQKSTADEQSVASLELKLASPESDPQQLYGESRVPDKIPQIRDTIHTGFDFKESGQRQPVDLKELLEQGTLGRFGDRYSDLMDKVQDSDRHSYEWERCLEICNGFLLEGNQTFGSLSSSSVLHEILSTDEGLTYLRGLVEIYLVARRIEEEMKCVSVNNSKLASLVKNINTEWNDIAAICVGSPVVPNTSSFDFKPCFLKADDYEARRKSCGVCLLNVDAKTPGISFGESGSKSLSYGGRQYHTTCANFWINCVSQTLPSLTIPELL